MKQLCKHDNYRIIDDILAPKWSTNSVRINVDKIKEGVEHYILQFVDESPKNKYGWFYLSGKEIRKHTVYPNGRGSVYEVPMDKTEPFQAVSNKECGHSD